jgi:multiple sugar transport system substrate-binding protein
MKSIRLLNLAVVVVLLLSFVMSCGPAATPTPTPVPEITVLYLDEPPWWREQAEEFTRATGIKVKWEGVPFPQLHDKMVTSLAAGEKMYDVIHVRDDYVAEFGSKGWLTPLDDYITDEIKGWSSETSRNNLKWNGTLYGLPRYIWGWQFYYNERLLKEAGYDEPPRTWEEMAEMAVTLTHGDQYGFLMPLGPTFAAVPLQIFLRARGGRFLDEEGKKAAFNSPEGAWALQFMVDLYNKYKVIPEVAFEMDATGPVADLFVQGNIAMTACTTHTPLLASDPERSRVVGDVKAALMPGSKIKSATYAETGACGIPATSDKKDLAWEYIKFVCSPEQQKKMALGPANIPAGPHVLADPDLQTKYFHFQAMREQIKYPYGMLAVPQAYEIRETMSSEIVAAIRQEKSVEQALADAEREINRILGATE